MLGYHRACKRELTEIGYTNLLSDFAHSFCNVFEFVKNILRLECVTDASFFTAHSIAFVILIEIEEYLCHIYTCQFPWLSLNNLWLACSLRCYQSSSQKSPWISARATFGTNLRNKFLRNMQSHYQSNTHRLKLSRIIRHAAFYLVLHTTCHLDSSSSYNAQKRRLSHGGVASGNICMRSSRQERNKKDVFVAASSSQHCNLKLSDKLDCLLRLSQSLQVCTYQCYANCS